ncbi:MAG: hypothetical protein QXP36_08495, partial [Conexivisphaerales archaeon]
FENNDVIKSEFIDKLRKRIRIYIMTDLLLGRNKLTRLKSNAHIMFEKVEEIDSLLIDTIVLSFDNM